MIIKITTEENGQRLDKFLVAKLPISRSQIQKMIKSGEILVNGETVSVHNFLKNDDEIKINSKEVKTLATPKKLKADSTVKLKIVYEDDNILVIDKPAGLLVHPTEKMEDKTLASALLHYYPKIKNVGDDPLRPGLVHRLDKNVSGLMLICKTQKAFTYFKKQFQDRKVKKVYLALVYGKMERPEATIDLPISRSISKGRMAVKSKEQGGKEAITHYVVKEQFNNFSLLDVEIMTGRTHQIRAHLNALQHPVVGDKLYTQKWVREKLDLDRPFLHSTNLKFTNIDGQTLEFNSKLPAKLAKILKELKA